MKSAHLHWLLELMVIEPVPLVWILPSFNGQHTNSLPIPNYKSEDYLQLLISALRDRSIAMVSDDHAVTLEDAVATVTRFEKHGPEKPSNRLMFRLTDAGGKAWESLAEPQWEKFFKFEQTYISSNSDDLRVSGLLASRNRDAVIAYLGWYERLESVNVQWDSLKIVTHTDYEAVYWKRLADVHEAIFDGVRQKMDRSVPAPVRDWQLSLNNWYVKPWNRPDWS